MLSRRLVCYTNLNNNEGETMGVDTETAHETARKVISQYIRNADRQTDATDAVVEALKEAGHLVEFGETERVEVRASRVAVETVEAFGLVLELDAHGNAVTVHSPHGMFVVE